MERLVSTVGDITIEWRNHVGARKTNNLACGRKYTFGSPFFYHFKREILVVLQKEGYSTYIKGTRMMEMKNSLNHDNHEDVEEDIYDIIKLGRNKMRLFFISSFQCRYKLLPRIHLSM